MDDLPREYSRLVDEVSYAWNTTLPRDGAVFIDGSPMTHDPRRNVRFSADPRFLNVAVIYDFIPLDWPGYLSTTADRIDYLSKIVRLRSFDVFFPISEYSAWRLSEVARIPVGSSVVTGASVRSSLYESRKTLPAPCPFYETPRPYFFTIGGGDRRKNTEVAVAAVRRLNTQCKRRISLKIVGSYDEAYKADLLRVAGDCDGDGFLEFLTGVDDAALVELYAGAIATICPSHIEGFSLPVVESAICGVPVIASTCAAHLELITQSDALFPSRDDEALTGKLERILGDRSWRERLVGEQAPIASRFHEREVGARFWSAIADRTTPIQLQRNRPRKSRIAFLTPYPPDRSGVARFSQLTIEAGTSHFDIDIYTDAPRPLTLSARSRDAGNINSAALLKGPYDSIVSVIGNSHFHTRIFEFFEQYGGPCILHDSRLTQIYYHRLGADRFREFAKSILGRPVSKEEVEVWLRDRDLPSLFVEPILKRARPLIVHTRRYQELLWERYGVRAEVTTFCPNMHFSESELDSLSRLAAREQLSIAPEVFLISTFGYIGKEKGMDACIIALELLRGWKVPAELHFVGNTQDLDAAVRNVAEAYGVGAYVHMTKNFVDNEKYRFYMLASDAAIQLRNYGLGQPSAALADCISAAMPCVASSELAESCDAPEYVLRVPDRNSPLHVAEQLASIWENRAERLDRRDAWRSYLEAHNFDRYVMRLGEILGLS